MLKKVTFKFPGTQKMREFIVYPKPMSGEEFQTTLTIQSDDAIAQVNITTGEGRYAVHQGGAHFVHLVNGKRFNRPRRDDSMMTKGDLVIHSDGTEGVVTSKEPKRERVEGVMVQRISVRFDGHAKSERTVVDNLELV